MPRVFSVILTIAAAFGVGGALGCSPARPSVPPSPLLDVVGLAAPPLDEATCVAVPAPAPRGLTRAAVYTIERLVWGPARVCDAAPLASDRRGGFTFGWVTVDPRGRVVHAARHWTAGTAREAAAAVDSALARATARPATAPLDCGRDPWSRFGPARVLWGDRGLVRRAFHGPGYQAIIVAEEQPGGFYSLRVEATARRFAGCREMRAPDVAHGA